MLKYLWKGLFLTSLCFPMLGQAKTLLICGVAKNCEPALQSVMRNCETLGNRFDDYRVIIYENNSTDSTAIILSEWATSNPKVTALTETLTQGELYASCKSVDLNGNPGRIELIARARNKVLDEANAPYYPKFDYVVMVDIDFGCDWCIDAICETIQQPGWDCVTTYGTWKESEYYDVFALRDDYLPLGPEFLGDYWWVARFKALPSMSPQDPWKKVLSAFGGMAIYRAECILPLRYSAEVTPGMKEEALELFMKSPRIRTLRKKYRGNDSKLTTWNSTYYFIPITCEHVSLHEEMRRRGHDRIFINPKLRLVWNQ